MIQIPKAKAAARVTLGSLYREDDYPSSLRLQDAFAFEFKPQPLPTGQDWRIDLPEADHTFSRRSWTDRVEAETIGWLRRLTESVAPAADVSADRRRSSSGSAGGLRALQTTDRGDCRGGHAAIRSHRRQPADALDPDA